MCRWRQCQTERTSIESSSRSSSPLSMLCIDSCWCWSPPCRKAAAVAAAVKKKEACLPHAQRKMNPIQRAATSRSTVSFPRQHPQWAVNGITALLKFSLQRKKQSQVLRGPASDHSGHQRRQAGRQVGQQGRKAALQDETRPRATTQGEEQTVESYQSDARDGERTTIDDDLHKQK